MEEKLSFEKVSLGYLVHNFLWLSKIINSGQVVVIWFYQKLSGASKLYWPPSSVRWEPWGGPMISTPWKVYLLAKACAVWFYLDSRKHPLLTYIVMLFPSFWISPSLVRIICQKKKLWYIYIHICVCQHAANADVNY